MKKFISAKYHFEKVNARLRLIDVIDLAVKMG